MAPTSTTDRYHHGNLPNALRQAAVEVIVERGVAGFSLREVARRAGVSHTAPAHHFGDVRGLLTSVAVEGFVALQQATRAAAADHDEPVDQLAAIGIAYVELARSHPAHCAVMFRPDVVDQDDPQLGAAGMAAYAVLEGTVQRVLDVAGADADADAAEVAAMVWSTVQGLVELGPKLDVIHAVLGRPPVATHDLIRHFATIVARGVHG